MAEPKPITIGPPWGGLCLVDSLETPKHDVCAVNIDYAYGAKRARSGLRWVATNLPCYGRMFSHVFGTEQRYIIVIGVAGTSGLQDVKAVVLTEYGSPAFGTTVADSTWNLTTLYGEPKHEGPLLCDAAGAILSTASGLSRTVTVITTQYQAYIFDPTEIPAYIVRPGSAASVSSGGDAVQLAGGSFPYFVTAPHGYILERHQEAYWYGGWPTGSTVGLSGTNPSDGTLTALTTITQNVARDAQSLGPWMVAYSDPHDSMGVLSWHIFAVDGYEDVTGLQSQQQSLLIFTPTSSYVLQGNDDSSFTKQTLSRGVGCAAHAGIVDAEGISFWLSYDGAYSWDGQGGLKCISERIKPLWTGKYQETVQSQAVDIETEGWPFYISRGSLKYATGSYHRPSHSIWWHIPVRPYQEAFNGQYQYITLVYYIPGEAWSIWLPPPTIDVLNPNGHACASLTADTLGGTVGYQLTSTGILWRYGFDWQDVEPLTGASLRVVSTWLSGRIMAQSDVVQQMRRVHLKLLAIGEGSPSNPVVVLRGDRYVLDPLGATSSPGESAVEFAPAPSDPNQVPINQSGEWDYAIWGTSKWQARDWFTKSCDTGLQDMTSGVRVGIKDPSSTAVCQSFTIELVAQLSTRARP